MQHQADNEQTLTSSQVLRVVGMRRLTALLQTAATCRTQLHCLQKACPHFWCSSAAPYPPAPGTRCIRNLATEVHHAAMNEIMLNVQHASRCKRQAHGRTQTHGRQQSLPSTITRSNCHQHWIGLQMWRQLQGLMLRPSSTVQPESSIRLKVVTHCHRQGILTLLKVVWQA